MFHVDNYLINLWLVVLGLFCNGLNSIGAENPKQYMIGGVLSTKENEARFAKEIADLRTDIHSFPPGVTFEPATVLMNPNPIRTALSVCEKLIQAQVYAVIVSHPSKGDLSPAAVSYTCGFYHIPVIGISSRDSAFSDKVRLLYS